MVPHVGVSCLSVKRVVVAPVRSPVTGSIARRPVSTLGALVTPYRRVGTLVTVSGSSAWSSTWRPGVPVVRLRPPMTRSVWPAVFSVGAAAFVRG